jgi:hypothetical protein
VVWAITQRLADGSAADLITSPFDNAGGPSRLESLLGAAITILMVPVATAMFLAFDLVIHGVSPG